MRSKYKKSERNLIYIRALNLLEYSGHFACHAIARVINMQFSKFDINVCQKHFPELYLCRKNESYIFLSEAFLGLLFDDNNNRLQDYEMIKELLFMFCIEMTND